MSGELEIATPRWAVPLLSPARYKAAHGGRASGKSHFFAEMLVENCLSEKIDAVCVREIQKSIKFSVKRTIESKIEALGVGHLFEIQDQVIKTPFGGIIAFAGLQAHTAESIKSLEGFNRCYIEEAQSISQRSLDLLLPTIMRTPGAELWAAWNPNLETDPIDVLFRGETPPRDSIVVEANYRDNPWLIPELLVDIERDRARDPEKYAHIWLGEYQRNSEARVFRNWRIDEFETPSNATRRFGADFGFSIDPTTLVSCFIGRYENGVAIADDTGRHLFIDYEAYEIGCEIDKTPQLFDTVPGSRDWTITADSARPETISYLRRNGFPKIAAAIKGARSVEEGVAFLQTFDIIIHPRCIHTADEFTMYSFKVDPLTDKVLPVLADKDNHLLDSARYALEGARRAIQAKANQVVRVVPVPKSATAWNRARA